MDRESQKEKRTVNLKIKKVKFNILCLYLRYVLKSLTTVFEGYFLNFIVAFKEDNVYYLSLMYIVGKAEVRVKRQ